MFIFISIKMTSFDEKIFNAVSDIANVTNNPFKGKWVSILGDSISTFANYIPEENTTFYPAGDVMYADETWWHILLTKLGAKLCVNNSWGGRKVCGSADADVKNAVNKLHRVAGQEYINLDGTKETATEDVYPDIILIMLGVNDFMGNVTLGTHEIKGNTSTNNEFYNDYRYLLYSIVGVNYQQAQVYCLDTTYIDKLGFLGKNTSGAAQVDYQKAIEDVTSLYCVYCIHVSKLSIHAGNQGTYEIDRIHPKANMMQMIANQCYHEMLANNCLG